MLTPTPTISTDPLATPTAEPCVGQATDFPGIGIDIIQLDALGQPVGAPTDLRRGEELRTRDDPVRPGFTPSDRAAWSGSAVSVLPGVPLRVVFRFDTLTGLFAGTTNAHRRITFGIRNVTTGQDLTRVQAETRKPRPDSERVLSISSSTPDVNSTAAAASGAYPVSWGAEVTDTRGRVTRVAGPQGDLYSRMFIGSDLVATWNPSYFYPRESLYRLRPQFASFIPEPGQAYDIYTIAGHGPCSWADGTRSVTVRVGTTTGNVRLTKSAPPYAVAGRDLTYALTVTNSGATPATAVTVTDPLPAGTRYVSADAAPTTIGGSTLSWNLGTLAPGATASILVTVAVDSASTGDLVNRACVATTSVDDPSDNCGQTTTPIVPPPTASADVSIRYLSTYDPRYSGPFPDSAVQSLDGLTIQWPTGETLYWMPHLALRQTPSPRPDLYFYRSRVVAWSYDGIANEAGVKQSAYAADSMGVAGCRRRALPVAPFGGLQGCVYAYVDTPTATQMLDQARHFVSGVSPIRDNPDTYVHVFRPLRGPTLRFSVLIQHQVFDTATGSLIDETTEPRTASLDVRLLVLRDGR